MQAAGREGRSTIAFLDGLWTTWSTAATKSTSEISLIDFAERWAHPLYKKKNWLLRVIKLIFSTNGLNSPGEPAGPLAQANGFLHHSSKLQPLHTSSLSSQILACPKPCSTWIAAFCYIWDRVQARRIKKKRHSHPVWGSSFHTKHSHKQLLVTFMFWLNKSTRLINLCDSVRDLLQLLLPKKRRVWKFTRTWAWMFSLCQLELRRGRCHGQWPNANSSANTDKAEFTGEGRLFHNFSPQKNHLVYC